VQERAQPLIGERTRALGLGILFLCTILVGSAAALIAIGSALFPDLCGNQVIGRYTSPDNQLDLVVFERDCGATTGFSTQASIVERGATLPNESGNLFDSDTNHDAAPAGPGGGPEVRVRWVDARLLSIAYHHRAYVHKSSRSLHGVSVGYTTFR